MAVAELETRASGYKAEYQFRRSYGQALREQAMVVLNPVLNDEAIQPDARLQLEEILSGNVGRIQVSEHAVRALFEADLLAGTMYTSTQLDDPGWRELSERGTRCSFYFVRLPRKAEEQRAVSSVGLTLSAEETPYPSRRMDFTRWVLERS